MLIFHYKTKKSLKESVGKTLRYTETSLFGRELNWPGSALGTNHPKRSWFAEVTVDEVGVIVKVK